MKNSTSFLPLKSLLLLGVCAFPSIAIHAQTTSPTNLALGAKVTVSSRAGADQDGNKITDGDLTNEGRWLSNRSAGPHIATLTLAKTEKIGDVQVISGYEKNGRWNGAIKDFVVQYRVGGEWKLIPEAQITKNEKPFLNFKLATPIETDGLMLVIQDAGPVRVYEVRAYAPDVAVPQKTRPVAGAK